MFAKLRAIARASLLSKDGGAAIVIGVTLPVLLGMIGLGTEATSLLYQRRQMQTAADSSALGAATALTRGYPSNSGVEALAIAASLGFVNGAANVTVTVNHPPASGSHTGNTSAIEVIVSQPQTLAIASFFTSTVFTVSARAVALQGSAGSYCVLATSTSAISAVSISNGASVTLNSCSLADNATGSQALSVTGGSRLTAQSVSVSGQAQVNNGASVTAPGGLNVSQPAIADPYANVAMPTSSGCTFNSLSLGWASGTQQLSPGTYCNGLSISNGAVVSLAPGIYYIESGSLSVGGGSTVTGSGVTIVLTKNTSNYATVSISNGATVTLSAPTTGTTAGIVFFADRNAPASSTSSFAGGSNNTITGALYFPSQTLSYSNGASVASACLQLIAWQIQFSGGITFNSNCTGTGVSPIGAGAASQLVE
jgi:Flp pilus assembly protein TadG